MFKAQHYFYIFLMYIHTYPEEDKMIDILETQRIKVRRSSWFHFFCIQLIFFAVMYALVSGFFLFVSRLVADRFTNIYYL